MIGGRRWSGATVDGGAPNPVRFTIIPTRSFAAFIRICVRRYRGRFLAASSRFLRITVELSSA